jgi:uncharacterized protein DUF6916
MLEKATAETFSPHVQSKFRIEDGPEVQLEEVRTLGTESDDQRAPFSIVFSGPQEQTLPQQTYKVEHDELGGFELFLVPLGPGRYEAVFG